MLCCWCYCCWVRSSLWFWVNNWNFKNEKNFFKVNNWNWTRWWRSWNWPGCCLCFLMPGKKQALPLLIVVMSKPLPLLPLPRIPDQLHQGTRTNGLDARRDAYLDAYSIHVQSKNEDNRGASARLTHFYRVGRDLTYGIPPDSSCQ